MADNTARRCPGGALCRGLSHRTDPPALQRAQRGGRAREERLAAVHRRRLPAAAGPARRLLRPGAGERVGALAGEIAAASDRSHPPTLAQRYAADRRLLSSELFLAHPYKPMGVTANLLVRREAFDCDRRLRRGHPLRRRRGPLLAPAGRRLGDRAPAAGDRRPRAPRDRARAAAPGGAHRRRDALAGGAPPGLPRHRGQRARARRGRSPGRSSGRCEESPSAGRTRRSSCS